MNSGFRTGETIYEVFYSVNINNVPVTPVNFDVDIYRNGVMDTGTTVSIVLQDAATGAYSSSWTASTVGDYQVYYKNESTSTIYITDIYRVRPDDEFGVKVFVGI